MALSLEEYAVYLDQRGLPWPAAPDPVRPKAKPHLSSLPNVRLVLWNVYGTLLGISEGELRFEHPQKLFMSVALEKTIEEFKMWASMSRKPGQPSEYMEVIYGQVLMEQRGITTGGERYPEVLAERVWEAIIKKLFQKDYKFDAGFYGSLNEFSRKVAYFFHASLQGTACYSGAAEALRGVVDQGRASGLLADGQCFTRAQLNRALTAQDESVTVEEYLPPSRSFLSHEVRARKPSETLMRHALAKLQGQGFTPDQILHVGTRMQQDLIPARRLGMRTALFCGDKASLQATKEQVKDPSSRPDVLLTELNQIVEVLS